MHLPASGPALGRRLLSLLAVLLLASTTARAQSGLPDMSKAPADVQAIWKKTMSGQAPTPAEAQKLAAWMHANRDAIKRGAVARTDTMKRTFATVPSAPSADQGPACPDRSPAGTRLAAAPPLARAADALLDSLRAQYASRGKPTSLAALDAWTERKSASELGAAGAAYYLGGYDAPSVITYIAAAKHASTAGRQKAWGDLGAALSGMRDDQHAIPVLLYALSLGARDAWLVHNLGVAYADLGDLAKADALLSEATRLQPGSGASWDALARVQSCEGNMTPAWHSMSKAQESDWNRAREAQIEKHDKQADPNTDSDDKAEAQRPIPMPPSFGGGRPPAYSAPTPALAPDFRSAHDREPEFISKSIAYQEEARSILAARAKQSRASAPQRSTLAGAGAGMTIVVAVTNGKEAEEGSTVALRRTGARLSYLLTIFNEATSRQTQVILPRVQAANQARALCLRADRTDCAKPYCRAMTSIAEEDYAARKAIVSQYIGGVAAVAENFNKAMSAWFRYADDPEYRRNIDASRRWRLATMAHDQFIAATQAGTGAYDTSCVDEKTVDPARATADSIAAQDPGKCEGRSANVVAFSIESDCRHLVITIDETKILPALKLDYQRATSSRNGSFYVGVSGSAPLDIASGTAGMKVTFDQGGWVQSFGPAAAGSLGSSLTGSVAEEGMVNLLSHGPAATGSFSATSAEGATSTVNFSVTSAPHFSGKLN